MKWQFEGQKVVDARESRGMTRPDLARRAEISYQGLKDIEEGKSNANADTICAICNALDCPPRYFFINR